MKHLHITAGPRGAYGAFRQRIYIPPEHAEEAILRIRNDKGLHFNLEEDNLNYFLDVYAISGKKDKGK